MALTTQRSAVALVYTPIRNLMATLSLFLSTTRVSITHPHPLANLSVASAPSRISKLRIRESTTRTIRWFSLSSPLATTITLEWLITDNLPTARRAPPSETCPSPIFKSLETWSTARSIANPHSHSMARTVALNVPTPSRLTTSSSSTGSNREVNNPPMNPTRPTL